MSAIEIESVNREMRQLLASPEFRALACLPTEPAACEEWFTRAEGMRKRMRALERKRLQLHIVRDGASDLDWAEYQWQ